MLGPPQELQTKRLVLRPPTLGDAEAIFESYARDPRVTKYLTWTPHTSIDTLRPFLERCEAGWRSGSEFSWGLWTAQTGEFAGMFSARARLPAVDLGYALAAEFWRQGLMSEVLKMFIPWFLAQQPVSRVWAFCDVENGASAGLLESVGMQREGILRKWTVHPNMGPEPRDCFSYSIVKASAAV